MIQATRFALRFLPRLIASNTSTWNLRYETFGGILSIKEPPMLVYLTRPMVRLMGFRKSELWNHPVNRVLSAPCEVHIALTNRCNLGCSGCYMDSGTALPDEMTTEKVKECLDVLAGMGVFHVALGGGESLLRKDIFEIAEYATRVNIVPNMTTNGTLVSRDNADLCRIFGQINVSIDGNRESYRLSRGIDAYEEALQGLRLLLQAGCRAGINFTLNRHNFDDLEHIARLAAELGANDVEILRFKPMGRGAATFEEMMTSAEQDRRLLGYILYLRNRYGVELKVDCSLVPLLCSNSKASPRLLSLFKVQGCLGGNHLCAIDAQGMVSACSFDSAKLCHYRQLPDVWLKDATFSLFRNWDRQAVDPCRDCLHLELCMGGCHAVSQYVLNDPQHKDPACPKSTTDQPSSF